MNQENILKEIANISYRIVKKEKEYAQKYAIKASEQVKKDVVNCMLLISQEITKFNFMKEMKNTKLESSISEVKIKDIIELIEILVKSVEEKYYYYYEITSSVIAYLDKIINMHSFSGEDSIRIFLEFSKYQISLEYQRNIRIKEHSEYKKIQEFIESRNNIIKFFHNKLKLQDYIYEEFVELKNALIEYENHMVDVELLEDEKLKSIMFVDFFVNYDKKIDTLLFIHAM